MPNQKDIQNFIESAKIYNTIGANKQQALNDEATRNDNYLLNQARLESSAFDLQRQQYELSQKQEQDRRIKREQALMSEAFRSSSHERTAKAGAEGEDMLSQQFTSTGQKLMASGSIEQGLAMLKEGQKLRSASVDKIKTDLELRAAKVEAQGEVASGVFDDASAQIATQEMAKLGFVVPEQYRNFTPPAQEWWKNRAMFSKNFARSIKAENEALRAQNDTIRTQQKDEELDFKKKQADRKELLARDKILQGRKLSFEKPKEQATEVKLLAEQDERFADLDSTLQKVVAKDVQSTALSYLKEDPALDQAVALQRARRDVLSQIGADGTYKVIADETPKPITKFIEGKVYTDANGNKAKYSNGKWIPQ